MAFGDSSPFATPISAAVFNQMARNRFVSQVRKASALANVAFGEAIEGVDGKKFSRDEQIGGARVEIPTLGQLRSIAGVADGAPELGAAPLTQFSGVVNLVADLGHYAHSLPIESSLIAKVENGQQKAGSIYELLFAQLMHSYIDKISQDLNATGASVGPATDRVGSWVHAVSDGVSTGETNYATFYTISRADAANSNYRSVVRTGVGDLGLTDIAEAQTAVSANMGNVDLGVCGATVLNKIRSLVEGYSQATVSGKLMDFGREQIRYAGIDFALENYCPTGTLGLLDSSTWMVKRRDAKFTRDGIIPHPGLVAGNVLRTELWLGVFCDTANKNAKLTGITS